MVGRQPHYFEGQMEPAYRQRTKPSYSSGGQKQPIYELVRPRSYDRRDDGWTSNRRCREASDNMPVYFGEEEHYENQRAYLAKKDPPRRSKSTPKHSQIHSCGSTSDTTLASCFPPREPEPPVKKKSKEAIISCEADANYIHKHKCHADAGPPKQVHLSACQNLNNPSASSNRSLCEDTFVVQLDPKLHDVKIEYTEGPKANKYIVRPGAVNNKEHFPLSRVDQNGNVIEEPHFPPKRGMDVLISTSKFHWCGTPVKPTDPEKNPCEDPNPWPVCDSYKPDANHPLNAFVSEVRLEFRDKNIKPNPGAEGRVFFDALKATKVDSVLLKVNYNITYGAEDGTQIKGAESNTYDIQLVGRTAMPTKNPPTLPDAEGKMKGAFKLTEGANEIPFKLTFPTDSIPTFTYVTDDGRTAISSYSVEAVVTLEKQTIQLGRLALTFPSFGMKKSPVGPQDVGTFKLALENKYCTPDSGLSLLVLDERGKTKSMSYKIARKVKCSALGLDGAQTIVYEGKLNKVKDSEILKRMKQQGVQIPEGYKAVFDESIPKELTLLPRSVAIDGFTCTYEIEVKCGKSETYETDIVVCDHLLDAPFQPRYLPEAVKNETGWRKIEKSK